MFTYFFWVAAVNGQGYWPLHDRRYTESPVCKTQTLTEFAPSLDKYYQDKERTMHVQRVLPSWHLVINYPRSIFIPALSELVPPLDTAITTEMGPVASCLAFGDKLPKVNVYCRFANSASRCYQHCPQQSTLLSCNSRKNCTADDNS